MNSTKTFVVLGEAPESESEEELDLSHSSPIRDKKQNTLEGSVIAGEAPESEDENEETGSLGSLSSALSASSLPSLLGKKESKKEPKPLLIKKLGDRNASLLKNMTDFVHQTVTNADKQLNQTNQQLLKCQVQLQDATTTLGTLNHHLSQIETTLSAITSTEFIPHINLESINS